MSNENKEQPKPCHFDGKDYKPCQGMLTLIRGDNGHPIGLSLPCNVNMNEPTKEYTAGAIYRWQKGKNNLAYINFCPICGENIEPRRG